MNKKYLGLVALLSLGGALSLCAGDNTTLQNAFKNGDVSGALNVYMERYNMSNSSQKNHGFTLGSVDLNYETGSFKGFKASLGFRGNHNINQVKNGDYGNGSEPSAVLHTANLSYTNDYFSIILGRQEVDLEWMGDFHEAYTGIINAIPDTTITYIHSVSYDASASKNDAALGKFDKTNGSNGIDVIDIKYDGLLVGMQLNGYYYYGQGLASWYGGKITFDNDIFGFTTQYAKSHEKVSATPDGSILALEVRANIKKTGLSAGYISTDKQGGVGSMTHAGDNINPLEDGNHVYDTNANTVYGSISYEIYNIDLSAMYGSTNYGNSNESELDIGLELDGKNYFKNFEFEAMYVNTNSNDITTDSDAIKVKITYTF